MQGHSVFTNESLNEKKLRFITAEIDSYPQDEIALLVGDFAEINEEKKANHVMLILEWINKQNVNEREKLFKKRDQLIFLHKDYEQTQKAIESEKIAQKNEKKLSSRLLHYFGAFLENLNVFSIFGAFTACTLGLVAALYAAVTTAAAFVGSLMVLAFSMPASLGTLIIGMGIELVNAVRNTETPKRNTVIASNLAILGLVGTAFMARFSVIPTVLMGFPIVIPLLFTGITAVSYYKDKKQLDYKDDLIGKNNQTIAFNKWLLGEELKKNNQLNLDSPTIQRITLMIAEATQKNVILEIQRQTLSSTLNTHKVSFVAMSILVLSAFVFPPLGLGAAIAGVVGMGVFLGTIVYGKQLRDREPKLIKKVEQDPEMLTNAIQEVEFKKAAFKTDNGMKEIYQRYKKPIRSANQEQHFHAGPLFKNRKDRMQRNHSANDPRSTLDPSTGHLRKHCCTNHFVRSFSP